LLFKTTYISIIYTLISVASAFSQGGFSAQPEFKLYPFARIVEGYSQAFVADQRQNPSPYWDIGAGFSYEYLTLGLSTRSHFLSASRDEFYHPETENSSEGHTVILVAHVEGKADVQPVKFVASIDLGAIWFREYDFYRRSWSRFVLPIIGLGVDFRVPLKGKIAICTGVQYMAAFEGFQVSAKEYNSVQGTVGLVYDGALLP